ncbi:hypothetical protein C8J27_1102 [Rhodobacter aestuarii]|uniref:Uncharacterized protein n=1 Tax=Rhodobacter aestuarii TaxID=453582 RepID=A0A1N7PZ45_9RHOB|nr:hypothetical protein [Rhodobacter aestuarii]PTV93953.1 hypothetical protein C8J27_1102 [Rhodobacter aestuarii]SIT15719.1 hypothetical protein SAMN05421580_1122 [Rhodobacter aestuarii]
MTLSRPVIVFAGAALVAAVAAFFIVSQRQIPARDGRIACDGTSVGLGAEAPWQYVALFSYDCAATAPVADRDARVRLALDYGYPSLLVRDIGEAETAQIVAAAIEEGDRGFFSADPHIAARVASWPEALRPPAVEAFLSTLPGLVAATSGPFDGPMLDSAPLWHESHFAPQIVEFCARGNCQDGEQGCGGPVLRAAKARVAQSAAALSAVQASCQPSFEWLRALRRAGLVDTACSSAFQINGVMQGRLELDAPCYDPQRGLGSLPVSSPADTLRFLRHVRGKRPDAATMEIVAEYFPEIATYLAQE